MENLINQNDLTEPQNTADDLERTQRDLFVLYEVSNAMRTTLELNHILYIILTGVTSHTGLGFNRAVLFLVNHTENCLEPKMAIGPESGEHAQKIWEYISKANQNMQDLIQEDRANNTHQSALFQSIKDLKIPLSQQDSLLGKAFHDGQPVHIEREEIAGYQDDPLLRVFKTHELIIMPLKAKDKVNGLIIADNLFTQKHITDDDLKIFTMLANQAGLAIENSRLYEIVIHKSHTDSLTNLWNHGYFQEELGNEIKNIQGRDGQCLTLMMLDLDNFKKLNDTLGHQNGDLVLKEIAHVIKFSSRERDFVCRYGGEEFAVILPQTTKNTAHTIAERIRRKIEDHGFPQLSASGIKVTVSIGLASLPQDAAAKEDLIALADKAMYIAKFSGKNRTCAC